MTGIMSSNEDTPQNLKRPQSLALSLSTVVLEEEPAGLGVVEHTLKDLFNKAGAAKVLLESPDIPSEEAIAPLITGWNRAAQGVIWFLSSLQQVKPGRRGYWRARLASVSDACSRWQEPLSLLLERHFTNPPDRDAPVKLEQCMSDLFEAAGILRDFRSAVLPRSGRRISTKRLAIILGAAVLSVLLGTALVYLTVVWGTDGGLSAKYCPLKPKGKPCVERIDPTVDFHWRNRPPIKGVGADFFTVEWHGCLLVEGETGPYLITGADDGIAVMVDQKIIIDRYENGPYRMGRSRYPIAPGVHRLDVFYREVNFDARVFLGWSFEGRRPVAIPEENLIPLGGNEAHRCPDTPAKLNRRALAGK
jgi:hypothetical protein